MFVVFKLVMFTFNKRAVTFFASGIIELEIAIINALDLQVRHFNKNGNRLFATMVQSFSNMMMFHDLIFLVVDFDMVFFLFMNFVLVVAFSINSSFVFWWCRASYSCAG